VLQKCPWKSLWNRLNFFPCFSTQKRNASFSGHVFPLRELKFSHLHWKCLISSIPFDSGSQPGCRGTQGCREEVSGVPTNIEFTTFFSFLLLGKPRIVILSRVRVPPNCFQSYRVPWTKKGWKTLPYDIYKVKYKQPL